MVSKILPLTDETIEDWRAAPIGDHSRRLHLAPKRRNTWRATDLRSVARLLSRPNVQVRVQVGPISRCQMGRNPEQIETLRARFAEMGEKAVQENIDIGRYDEGTRALARSWLKEQEQERVSTPAR